MSNISTWIVHMVSGHYKQSKLEASLQALEYFWEMDSEAPRFGTVTECMVNAPDMEKINYLKNFTNVERFMRVLFDIIEPNAMKNPPKPQFPGDKATTWTLKHFYKEAFNIVDFSFNLTRECNALEKYEMAPNYLYAYLWIYRFRNNDTHEIVSLPMDVVNEAIRSTLIVQLDLCYRFREKLAEKYSALKRKESFPAVEFCEQIKQSYEDFEKKGFGYVDMHWVNNEEKNQVDCSVENLILNEEWKQIKILGEAGSGKSTALKRIEYILARNFKKHSNAVIPVYIELYKLVDGNQIILNEIAGIMNIESSLAEEFLKNGELCLLLDGYNEILDLAVKKKAAKELDAFVRTYGETRIFLTDRALSRESIPTINSAKRMHLRPITMEDRKAYFEKNCTDEECLNLILEKMGKQPEYFELMNTPLKLKQLLDVVTYRRMLPEEITHDYIQYLMDREANEKKDENIEYLQTFLQSLAIMEQEEVPMLLANAQMAKCKMALGFSLPDTNQCLKLAIDMGILACEEGMVHFITNEYRDYFMMEGLANQLDMILQ